MIDFAKIILVDCDRLIVGVTIMARVIKLSEQSLRCGASEEDMPQNKRQRNAIVGILNIMSSRICERKMGNGVKRRYFVVNGRQMLEDFCRRNNVVVRDYQIPHWIYVTYNYCVRNYHFKPICKDLNRSIM